MVSPDCHRGPPLVLRQIRLLVARIAALFTVRYVLILRFGDVIGKAVQ